MLFQRVNEIPATLRPKAIEAAVAAFVEDSDADKVPHNHDGLYAQLIENIAGVLVFKNPGRFFWLAEDAGEVAAFAMTHISKDVDNSMCYWMTAAWVRPEFRHKPQVKQWAQQLQDHAKQTFCRHILIPSSRGSRGYCRFLGRGWHPYVTLLKQDIN